MKKREQNILLNEKKKPQHISKVASALTFHASGFLSSMTFSLINAHSRCFIMEDRGYLVAHPTLIDPKGHAPAEQQHITHKVNGLIRIFTSSFVLFFLSGRISFSDSVILNASFCVLLSGAAGGQWHPEPPQLCEEKPVQQLQRSHRAAFLQVQHQHNGASD